MRIKLIKANKTYRRLSLNMLNIVTRSTMSHPTSPSLIKCLNICPIEKTCSWVKEVCSPIENRNDTQPVKLSHVGTMWPQARGHSLLSAHSLRSQAENGQEAGRYYNSVSGPGWITVGILQAPAGDGPLLPFKQDGGSGKSLAIHQQPHSPPQRTDKGQQWCSWSSELMQAQHRSFQGLSTSQKEITDW